MILPTKLNHKKKNSTQEVRFPPQISGNGRRVALKTGARRLFCEFVPSQTNNNQFPTTKS
jgi:hypothetical protein